MPRIRLKQQARGTVNGEVGQVVETDEHHAEAFVRDGYADLVDEEPARQSEIETATDRGAEEAETATETRPARGRRAGKG